jgi:hypothetical protein
MALVSPASVICRNGSKDDICNQLICAAYDRFGSIATEDGKAKTLTHVRFAPKPDK